MSKRYLPAWATADEAADWLRTETGEAWPLTRLLEVCREVGIWLEPSADTSAEQMDQVFMGRAEGFMARLTFEGDIQRLAAVRSGGALSMTRRPDGELVSFSPPAPFRADDVRFSAESVRAIAKTHEAETATKLAQSLAQAQALRAVQGSNSAAPRPIKVQAASRISVAEVKRLIQEALPAEPAFGLWEASDGTMELRPEPDGCFSRAWLDHEFEEACKKGQITPRHQFLPTRTDYHGGDENDPLWLVEHEAFVWFAGLYGLPVELLDAVPLGGAPSAADSDSLTKVANTAEGQTPPPLTTPELADAFDGVDGQTAQQWRRKLGDVKNHKWLLPARHEPATAPNAATWWPLLFAELLLARDVSAESLNRVFMTRKLKPWLLLWQEKRRERNAFGQ
jgi:hypothetical protein